MPAHGTARCRAPHHPASADQARSHARQKLPAISWFLPCTSLATAPPIVAIAGARRNGNDPAERQISLPSTGGTSHPAPPRWRPLTGSNVDHAGQPAHSAAPRPPRSARNRHRHARRHARSARARAAAYRQTCRPGRLARRSGRHVTLADRATRPQPFSMASARLHHLEDRHRDRRSGSPSPAASGSPGPAARTPPDHRSSARGCSASAPGSPRTAGSDTTPTARCGW